MTQESKIISSNEQGVVVMLPEPSKAVKFLSLAQASYFVSTGILPFISMRLFMAVTGPKVDQWLVKTVGALVTVIGLVVGLAGFRGRKGPELPLLAAGSAAGLAGIDVYYSLKGRISKIYLLDALLEFFFIAGWSLLWKKASSDK
ncbi:MAG TPA: hypothetical protein VH186_19520 [Chloroflexia bacterium]|nr:hypothetical protein [Chloroflexia bacterium]